MSNPKSLGITLNRNLQKAYFNKEIVDTEQVNTVLRRFKKPGVFSQHLSPVYYVLEYATLKYFLFTENIKKIIGYDARDFLDGGLDFSVFIYNKGDFKTFNEKIYAINTGILKEYPIDVHEHIVFSHSFRVMHPSGKWIQLYENSAYITTPETGLPTYAVGMISDISLVKNNDAMLHHVHLYNDAHEKKLLLSNSYYSCPDEALLTKRETEILKWMAEGWSTKMISEKLKISENTIGNHRQNMLRKTNSANVAQLIAFAIRNGII